MENAANRIALTGALDTLPEYSHTNHDRNFYRLTLCVERLSGAVDLLPVLAAEDVLNEADQMCIRDRIEAGEVSTLIVKDASRLGREYLQVGYYMEIYFPQKNVRFIAVNDGVDSVVESSNDFNPCLLYTSGCCKQESYMDER